MDNLDAGCIDIPLTSIVFQTSVVSFLVPSLDAEFAGNMGRDGHKVKGEWRTGEDSAPLTLYRVTPSEIDGIWTGDLTGEKFRLRLVFYLGTARDSLIGAMKSVDQGGAMVPLSAVRRLGSAVVLEVGQISGRFEATLDETLGAMGGDWIQAGTRLPLKLKRVSSENETDPERPQEPKAPFPYCAEEVRYWNRRAGCEVAGTLTIPLGAGPFPAVLLISGSGPHDRDGSMAGHRPFLVLADHLTRRGIAVLRSDDRGVGESGGDFSQATTSDLASDAEAAVAWLRSRPEIAIGRIGLIGHSEGGLIAAMVGARDHDVALIVLMAAPGVPPLQLARDQARREAEIYGRDGEAAAELNGDIAAIVRHEPDPDALRRKLHERLKELPAEQRGRMVESLMHPWQRHYLSLDPADFLGRVGCAVLALNGSHDRLVDSQSNLEAIRTALETAGNMHVETRELPGLNHLFQTCETGSMTEYRQIAETLAPTLLASVENWLCLRFSIEPDAAKEKAD